ncbi:MAG TPA: LuxR C-terminal-related transcriptional regulator [Sedimentibacter sp.]|nr:LuxR C-terminal-related transcriptional regulator [Sedimentibacter sp.]
MSYQPPRLNHVFISDRLKQQLVEIKKYPITTVIAPMGFGKTTALNWWAKQMTKKYEDSVIIRQMIVSDSLGDFWTGFCRAFKEEPDLAEKLKELGFPKDATSMALFSELIRDALSGIKSHIYYILDDLHLLGQDSLASLLMMLSGSMPECAHIILISRNQIFTDEEKMRLGSLLFEIGTKDLRLNRNEISSYVKHCGLEISKEELDELALLTEGWISMIYLNFKSYVQNGTWLSKSSDILTLIDEVLLKPLPLRHRKFLILIGMADEFTPEQAAYLWGQSDWRELLDSLTKNNAFITKEDNGVYRYHYMLSLCVRRKFAQKPDKYKKDSYSRLGAWYFKQGEYLPAYYAYACGTDWKGLLKVLERDKGESLNAEHSKDFFGWMRDCPEEILLTNPVAIIVCMVKMFSYNNIAEIKRLKKLLLKALDQNPKLTLQERNNLLGDAEVAESFLCYNDLSAMCAHHKRACALLNRTTISVDKTEAWTFSAPSVLMMYHRRVGYADSENAEMKGCMPYYYKIFDGHGAGSEHSFAADLHYERGQITDADISNRMALSAAKQKNQYSIMVCCGFLSMRMALLDGDYDKIKKLGDELRDLLYKERQYTLLNTLDMCLGFIYALLGYPDKAPVWMAEGKLTEALVMFPATPMLNTFYNHLLLAKGEWTEVIARKEDCLKLYSIYPSILCEIRLHIQLSAAFLKLDRRMEALTELKTALDLALPDRIITPFAESEEYISELLEELKNKGVYSAEITKIMVLAVKLREARQNIGKDYFGEDKDYGLTNRELKIARLAAQRKTNTEIAIELKLAQGTVRNHLSRVYDKLGISGDGKNKRLALESILKVDE